ncbi:MAG: hypothetical protein AAFV47_09230 [Pseudomonadota bacterium]
MVRIYGKAFIREHGSEPNPAWVQAISRLGDQQIRRGLANLANQALAFPPNLGQFVAAAKTPPPQHMLGPSSYNPPRIGDQSLETRIQSLKARAQAMRTARKIERAEELEAECTRLEADLAEQSGTKKQCKCRESLLENPEIQDLKQLYGGQ